MTASLQIFRRTVIRPMLRDRLRTALTVLAVGLGVAEVVAIGLASEAATGSFRSSLETLAGTADLEISALDGVDETLLGELASLPYPVQFSPRVEGYGTLEPAGRTIMIAGLDLIGIGALEEAPKDRTYRYEDLDADTAAWAGTRVAAKPGDQVTLTIHSDRRTFEVQGLLEGEGIDELAQEDVLVLDLPTAQTVLGRQGRLDRILVFLPDTPPPAWVDGPADWQQLLRQHLPEGVELKTTGARTAENRKMLGAFRWNLRVLSYIALVVGALLIYNTISVSVVRRRNEIGVIRALGATRRAVRLAFLAEAAFLGFGGAVLGLVLGRVLAEGAVGPLAQTVQTLYVSSAPGEIALGPGAYLTAAVAGIGVAIFAALIPAAEAARVAPSEAMARGRRERAAWGGATAYLVAGLLVGAAAAAASFAPPIGGKPLFGYAAAFALIGSLSLVTPALILSSVRALSPLALRLAGAEGFLAIRGLKASLPRTSVLVAALGTAVAMLVSVAIMVGSYRETVVAWLDGQLRADLFLRAAGSDARDEIGLINPAVGEAIRALPEVDAVDQFRAYNFSYNGLPAVLGTGDAEVASRMGEMRFVHGEDPTTVIERMQTTETCIVSEPFSNKHRVRAGDTITLPLGEHRVEFEIAAVFYDYGNESGTVIVDRSILMRYVDNPWPQNLAVYLKPHTPLEQGRAAVETATANSAMMLWSNRELRSQAMTIFDRTFAVTYALEVIAVAVAILGMAGALLALVIDRRRTYAVLRFVGASARQIWRLTLIEAGLLGLLANLAGLLLGTALSFVLIFVINKQSFGWTIQFHPPQALVAAALGLVLIASIAAGLYPARLATQLNPIEAVHEE